ncbi:MAG: putative zinc-binding protein [Syntrophales bacterium]|nr:putative zinc-binding protein [Syntrophales bacterium]MDD5641191.1 putative zinc-binding protein [Syntrophales bacterium]
MGKKHKKVVVLPCSGIGKVFGALARETMYELLEKTRPGTVATTCLPLLVIKDPEAVALVTENPVITIDGCPKDCAKKSVEALGKAVDKAFEAIKFYKEHKDLKPEGIAEVNETGCKLAVVAAEEVAKEVDKLAAGEVA